MGLRCLMGHDYGALQTEREREDRGDEAVVTVREFKECGRCGHRLIVSENKEITSVGARPSPDEPAAAEPSAPEPDPVAEPPDEYDDVSAEEDDGVILDDAEPEAARGRGRGDWPEAADEDPDADETEDDGEPEPWPEVEHEDEGIDAKPSDGGPVDDVEFGGLTPEPTAGAEAAEADSSEAGDAPAGIRSVEPAGGQRIAAVDARVVCPECDHTAPARGSSLRPGDICPECRRGYLVERES